MMDQELQRLGWSLSFEGLEQCKEACPQKGAGFDVQHILRLAINRDLREIGKPVLPEFASRNGTGELSGPVIVQVQRLKNVGVPTAKQHSDAVSKRLLRLQLTDGHAHCNAIEIDGPIPGLSPSTPPGTKLKIVSKVQVVGGFVLLKPGAVQVCGGIVEHMIKKWNLQKISAEEVQRDRVGDTSGPPPFVPFEKTTAAKPPPTKTQPVKISTAEKGSSGEIPTKASRSSTALGSTSNFSLKPERGERKPTKDTVGRATRENTREVSHKSESSSVSKQTDQRERKTYGEYYRAHEKKDNGGATAATHYDKQSQKDEPQKKPAVDHFQSVNQPSSKERSGHYNRSARHQSDRRGERSEHMGGRRRNSDQQGQRAGRTIDLSEWIGTRIAGDKPTPKEPAMIQREEPFSEWREQDSHSRHQHDQYHHYQHSEHDQHQSDRHQRDQHDRYHDRHQSDQHKRDQHDRHQSDRHQRDQHDRHQSDHHQRDQHDRHQSDHHQRDQHDRHQSDRHQRDQHDRHQSDRHQRDQHDRHQSDRHQRDQHDRHQSDRHQRGQHDRHQRDQHDRHQSDRHQRDQHDQHQSDRHQRDQHDRHQSDHHQRDQSDRHQYDRYHHYDQHQHQSDRSQPQRFPTSSEPPVLEQYHWDKIVNSKSTMPFSAKPSVK